MEDADLIKCRFSGKIGDLFEKTCGQIEKAKNFEERIKAAKNSNEARQLWFEIKNLQRWEARIAKHLDAIEKIY